MDGMGNDKIIKLKADAISNKEVLPFST